MYKKIIAAALLNTPTERDERICDGMSSFVANGNVEAWTGMHAFYAYTKKGIPGLRERFKEACILFQKGSGYSTSNLLGEAVD